MCVTLTPASKVNVDPEGSGLESLEQAVIRSNKAIVNIDDCMSLERSLRLGNQVTPAIQDTTRLHFYGMRFAFIPCSTSSRAFLKASESAPSRV
jgi:hypothetical protein